jgi:hypothetical protein
VDAGDLRGDRGVGVGLRRGDAVAALIAGGTADLQWSPPDPGCTETAPAAVVAPTEAGVGAVAGEGVLVVDGEPGASPSPVEDLTAVRATD